MDDDTLEMIMAQTISTSKYKWRTVRSIARQVSAEKKQVEEVLNTSKLFVRAKTPNARGEFLYTTSKKYKEETSLFSRFIGAGANTIIG